MKKLFLLASLLVVAALFGVAQNIQLIYKGAVLPANAMVDQAGNPDTIEIVSYLVVKNAGSASIDVVCKKSHLSLLDSTETSFCWAGGCYPPTTFVSPNHTTLAPGAENNEFSGHYIRLNKHAYLPGESIIRWVFYNRNNPSDSNSVTVKYTTYPMGLAETISGRVHLSNVYPNPADAFAKVDYVIPSGSEGRIVVRDMVGNTLFSQMISNGTGNVQINTSGMATGIYFCSLVVNDKMVETRKVVVRH